MVFKPETPGDYEHYAYAGEIATGFGGETNSPTLPVTDAAGHVYVMGNGEEAYNIEEFAPATPSSYPGPHPVPICRFAYNKKGLQSIQSIAVNPTTGEPFFFSYKKETGGSGLKVKLIHQLGPCNEATHKFEAGGKEEVAKIEVKPERDDLYGMAYDPGRTFPAASGRPAGTLYAAAPSAVPDIGTGQPGAGSLGYVFAPPPPPLRRSSN